VKSRAVPVAEVRDCVDAGEAGWLDDVVRLPSRLGAPGLVATDLASASKSTSGVTATHLSSPARLWPPCDENGMSTPRGPGPSLVVATVLRALIAGMASTQRRLQRVLHDLGEMLAVALSTLRAKSSAGRQD
jgi:hypothetical protein